MLYLNLWAYDYTDETVAYLKSFYDSKEKIPPEIHEKYESLLREYLVVGGMPEVVASFAEFKDFTKVQEIQDKLIGSNVGVADKKLSLPHFLAMFI